MLKIILSLLFVFGLLGVLLYVLRFIQKKQYKTLWSDYADEFVHVSSAQSIDKERKILTIRQGDKHHTIMIGPHNDILLNSQTIPQANADKTNYEPIMPLNHDIR